MKVSRSRDGKDERCSKVIRKGKTIQQNALCKAQSTVIGDGRQKHARQLGMGEVTQILAIREGARGWQRDVEDR